MSNQPSAAVAGWPTSEWENGYADTYMIGGSRFPLWAQMAFDPNAYVGTTQVSTLATLSAPPTYSQLGSSNYAGMSNPMVANAGSNPWSPVQSPTPLILVALVLSLFALHWLYYKERRRG